MGGTKSRLVTTEKVRVSADERTRRRRSGHKEDERWEKAKPKEPTTGHTENRLN